MQYTELGSTGLDVSVLSLGAGGPSKLGIKKGKTEREAQDVVESGFDHGINMIDTAEAYGTEEIIGRAIDSENREEIVISTKFQLYDDGELRPPDDLEASVDRSLERLNTEYIDVYHLHGLTADDYAYAIEELRPEMVRLKEEGKIRLLGLTESVSSDPRHEMLTKAVDDDLWDVVMVGFNLLNHTARQRVLKPAAESGIGTIGMVSVRRALADQQTLEETVEGLIAAGELDPAKIDPNDPFGFLIHEEGATDLIDAAYRFCRHEPTVDTILTGTSNPEHLAANVESVLKPPLPEEDLSLLHERFGHIDSVLGN